MIAAWEITETWRGGSRTGYYDADFNYVAGDAVNPSAMSEAKQGFRGHKTIAPHCDLFVYPVGTPTQEWQVMLQTLATLRGYIESIPAEQLTWVFSRAYATQLVEAYWAWVEAQPNHLTPPYPCEHGPEMLVGLHLHAIQVSTVDGPPREPIALIVKDYPGRE